MNSISCVLAILGSIAIAMIILDYRDNRKNKEDDEGHESTFFKDEKKINDNIE